MSRPAKRKADARELLRTAIRGPSLSLTFVNMSLSDDQRKKLEDHMAESYRLWSSTWIIPKLVRLIPELKGAAIPPISSNEWKNPDETEN